MSRNDGDDTIYALSSGQPPAAIAVIRISGATADAALQQIIESLPAPRHAGLFALRHPVSGETLDRALVIRFPGPNSTTGEDVAELHLHGGRAVVAAVLQALAAIPGLRPAQPGEFTRRAFENGRLDLAEAEGLADLLMAETQSQRRAALALAEGSVSRMIGRWQASVIDLAARIEAAIDFSDEGEVGEALPQGWLDELNALLADMETALAKPSIERLRDGLRVVIAGPPNAGKSTLLNVLAGREAAITSAIAGTTRDLVEAPTAIGGAPFLLIDTAGLRESEDEVEAIGVGRAWQCLERSDIILWLGRPEDCPAPERAILLHAKSDLDGSDSNGGTLNVSAHTGEGMDRLTSLMIKRAASLLPQEGEVTLNMRHRAAVAEAATCLEGARDRDLLIAAEFLRQARAAMDRVTGQSGVEDMLDSLFGRFCIGK